MPLRPIAFTLFVSAVATIVFAAASNPPADWPAPSSQGPSSSDLDRQFSATVGPFLNAYCVTCHSGEKPKGDLDLKPYANFQTVLKDIPQWSIIRDKLDANEMPPKEAKVLPTVQSRQQIIAWIDAVHRSDAMSHAGDPGDVLARRLSNAEYDNTIRDLTGFDLHPTREFPVDPSNMSGFDNSGESLAMSPSLLNKYIKAARDVADHMYLKQVGFGFAPKEMISDTDRDQFCEQEIIAVYHSQDTDYADYFLSAWKFKNRLALGKGAATLADVAAQDNVSPKYLATVWSLLEEAQQDVGPVAMLQARWRALPAADGKNLDAVKVRCAAMRDYVVQLRAKVEVRIAGMRGAAGQSGTMWLNNQIAIHRLDYDPGQLQIVGQSTGTPATKPAPPTQLASAQTQPAAALGRGGGRGGRGGGGRRGGGGGAIVNTPGDPDLVVPAARKAAYEASFAQFCSVFPDRFYIQERGSNYVSGGNQVGRLLSAGFTNRMGYSRDDYALYNLLLNNEQQKDLDSRWRDLDFIASATKRTYLQSFDASNSATSAILGTKAQDENLASEENIKKYVAGLLARGGGNSPGAKVTQDYYQGIIDVIKWSDQAHIDAVPGQMQALQDLAARAYRRPLTASQRDDLLSYYQSLRDNDHLDHEAALRETIVYILVSPDLMYRVDLAGGQAGVHPLSDYDLASRLSYFLWASMPDENLLAHAAAGDLHDPAVLTAQAQRMLHDPKVRGMAMEFGGNWLEFRHFEDIQSVDRQRFATFTNELRDAMFEEPVRFLVNAFQTNRSILDFLYAKDTFVNPVLAKHYGIPDIHAQPDEWVHIEDATPYDRGGLLPMAAFLTKNAPGLRTSPVKRGNWLVKNFLGLHVAPPPAGVPVLPNDESKLDLPLRDMLAAHRADPSCAACHAKFDSFGLVFEGYGPIGEHRLKDLAGHPVDAGATFPDGTEATGLSGVKQYIRDHRQNDYISYFSGKILAYALSRSLIPSDDLMIEQMGRDLAPGNYKFDSIVETIVSSPQFLTKRGRENLAER